MTTSTVENREDQTTSVSVGETARRAVIRAPRVGLYTVLIVYSLISLAPFVFAIIASFETYAQVLTTPPTFIPHPFVLGNYQEIFTNHEFYFLNYITNSLIYAIGAAIFNVLLGAMAGYAFGRMEFPFKNLLFGLTLAVMMIPGYLIIVPKFLVADNLHLVNSMAALIVPALVSPTSVFLMTQFLKTLPRELEESARIDGASQLRIFWQVILPLTRPALTAVGLFAFQGAWNDFLWPLLVSSSPTQYTLTVGLTFFKGAHYTQYNLLLAGATLNILPLVILFFIFQRYFISGISTAGLGGR
ncbi:MAG TPA: carbohydrate ABC transporter permease [Ktedonobacterales bacterium]